MTRSAARINYNRMSRWYDWFANSEKQFMVIGERMLNIHAGEKVLEIGFGTGHALIDLARSVGEDGKVFGIDLSDGMFAVAQGNISRAGLSSRIDLHLGDAVNLPFSSNFFDAIFISFTLELFNATDIPLVLGECIRVLKKDGRVGVVALDKKDCRAVKIYEWFHARMPSLVDCRPIYLFEILDAAGFKPAQTMEETMWGLPVIMITARKHG